MRIRPSGVRRLVVMLSGLAVLGAACSSDSTDTQGPGGTPTGTAPVTVTEITQTGLLPFFATVWPLVVADYEGFFDQRGLDVTTIWGFEGPQIFGGERAEILIDSSETGLTFQAHGLDVVAFFPLATRTTNLFLASGDIQSPEDLIGKSVGVSDVPSTDMFLSSKWLESQGVSPDDIDFVKINEEHMLPAIDSGRIAAAAGLDEVLAYTASLTGNYTILATPEDLGTFPWTILQTRRTWLEENPDAARAYVEAVFEGVQFILDPANKDQVVEDVVAESEGAVDATSMADAFDLVVSTPNYYSSAPLTVADVEPALEALVFEGFLPEGAEVDLEAYLAMDLFAEVAG
jgi:ABC-type nitrate/sulfonate/bicarbonate transport system substrate-binding protein